jgi:hypothetical protein
VTAPSELPPHRSHRGPVAVEVAFVAANEPDGALKEWSQGSEIVVLQVLLDDAVEDGINAARFRCDAFVVFERPTPRVSANASMRS